jgi:hypothetical protein
MALKIKNAFNTRETMNNDPNNETVRIRVKWHRRKWREVLGQPVFRHPCQYVCNATYRLRKIKQPAFFKASRSVDCPQMGSSVPSASARCAQYVTSARYYKNAVALNALIYLLKNDLPKENRMLNELLQRCAWPTLLFPAECIEDHVSLGVRPVLKAFAETIVILGVHGHEDGINVLVLGEPVPMWTGAICYEGV